MLRININYFVRQNICKLIKINKKLLYFIIYIQFLNYFLLKRQSNGEKKKTYHVDKFIRSAAIQNKSDGSRNLPQVIFCDQEIVMKIEQFHH